MNQQIALVKAFHEKFHVLISSTPSLITPERSDNRYRLMKDEVEEYLLGAQQGDIENIAKELCDILYTVYGTILEHGLQDKITALFEEVHTSNMSKDYHEYQMIKGASYRKPNIKQFFQDSV